ncbi:hypothetical protein ACFOWX_09810 [Sphingorhabdus arenilitoris]|uniref:Uncharacterized protein n=1 Tax=Sphingorhabdus arenilitoris TaxID=1490041 RepID=A0ABV8RH86_9SPHN
MIHYDDHDELTEDEASGGTKNHGVRYVLAVSLFLAIGILSASWMGFALYGTPPDPGISVATGY